MNSTVRGVPDLLPMTPAASARQRGTFPHHDVAPLSRRAFRPGRIAAAFLLAAFSLPLAPGASAESLSAEDLWNEHVGTGTDTTPPRIVSVQRTGDERERTSASTLGFDVTFSEPVHVDSGDLEIARSPGSWRRVQMNTGMHDDEMGRLKVAGDSYYKPCDPDEDRIRAHLDDGTASRLIERLDDECNRREQLSRHWHVLASGGAMSGAIHFEVDLVVAANHDMADIHGNRLDPTLPTGDHYQGYTIDRLRPTPLLSADVETHDGSTPFEVTVDFTRPVKGFRVDDLRTRNATIDELRGSDGDQEYFLTVTPQGTRDVGIRVRGYTTTRVWRGFRNRPSRNLIVRHKPTGVRDRAGNGNLAATQLSVPVDNTAPTPALSASPATHDGSSTSVVTIDFGEAVTGFAVGDIGVSRGSASGFTGDDGDSSYTVTVTPGGNADVGVSVAADVATDLAGNANLAAAAPLTVTYGATGATSATGAVTPVLGLTSRAGGVTLSTAALSVPEGSRNSYTAVLNEQPTANVTVSVARAAGGDADLTVSPASRTFTTSNWNTPQTFTVSAAREPRSDGFDIHPRFDSIDGTARFTHSVTSTDTNYDIADIAVLVATEDDADEHEVAWVFPSRNQGNDVGTGCLSEGGTTDAYQARLSALPGADVRVELHELFQDPVASGGGHIVAVDAAGQVLDALTFTPGNWNVPQRFFFSMPQDNDGETQDAAFELRATSTDADWHGLNGYDHIDICARDDDAIGWDITPREPSASEGTSVTYRIGPRTQPVGAIHLTLSVANEDAAGSVSPATVTFAHDDWAAKTVTVTFAADANAIDGTATVTHAPRSFTSRSGIDPSYTRPVPDVRVRETESSGAGGTEAPESGLAARFGTLPEWHAGMAFWTELHFSEAPHLGYKDVRDKLLEVTGGRLLSAQRLEQGNRSWRIEVLPAGFDDLELTLPATEDCAAEGAVCTADGERMEEPLSVTVPGPGERLAAKLTGFSTRHAGEPFEPELWFNHAPNISYRDVRDTLFEATGGRITRAKRQQQGSNLRWNLVVEPEAVGNLTLTLPATEDCAAPRAVCTQDGRKLARALSVTIEGPAAFSVSDAQVDEGSEAVLAFEVSLSRRLRAEARVDVATRDGTATAGADYEAVTQTLVFARGETVKTVEVAVLDDAHDEGEETMTLVLSNAEAAPIDDAEGTGTIVNSDAIPKAWIARFGRTVTGQVLDAVEGRLAAQRQAGMQATVAGYALPSWDGGATAQTAAQSEDRLAMAALGSWMARAGDGVNRFGSGDGFGAEGGLDQRTVSGRELLYGTVVRTDRGVGGGPRPWLAVGPRLGGGLRRARGRTQPRRRGDDGLPRRGLGGGTVDGGPRTRALRRHRRLPQRRVRGQCARPRLRRSHRGRAHGSLSLCGSGPE